MSSNQPFIPSLFTFLNLFFGFFAIIKIFEGNLHTGAWFIILCALCDGMDGKLARWTGMESAFGLNLDSLSDLVSFGVAPALLAYVGILHQIPVAGMLVCFLLVLGGAYRLARFNVQQIGRNEHIYMGLTIPISAVTVASLWLFQPPFDMTITTVEWFFLIFLLAMLMMSTVPYRWPRLSFQNGVWKKIQSIIILVAVCLLAVFPERTLFPLFCCYILVGVVIWSISCIKGEVELVEFFLSVKRN